MARYRCGSVQVDVRLESALSYLDDDELLEARRKDRTIAVDVEVGDVIDQIDDEVLLAACRDRDLLLNADSDLVAQAVEKLQRGQVDDALLALERLMPIPFNDLGDRLRRHYRRLYA